MRVKEEVIFWYQMPGRGVKGLTDSTLEDRVVKLARIFHG